MKTLGTQEEAAEAYDIAAIKFRGANAVTNFDVTRYDVEKIMASSTLLSGELAKRNREIIDGGNHINNSDYNNTQKAILSQKSCESQTEWNMALYQSSSQQMDQNPSRMDTYKTQSFPMGFESVVHQEVED